MNDYEETYNRMTEELSDLQDQIKDLPKGALRKRQIRDRVYYYLQYRDGAHVRSRYVKADEVAGLKARIESRKDLLDRARDLERRMTRYAQMIGVHRSFRPVRNVDYEAYTLFMSTVAHDHKSMKRDAFLDKYCISRYRGLNKRYLMGFLDYINGIDRRNMRRTNDLVLDPYTYLMYFKYGKKEVLNEELRRAIPAFLNRGLLITNVQEAVNSAFDK